VALPELSADLLEGVRQLTRTLSVLLGDGALSSDGSTIDRHKNIEQQEALSVITSAVSALERKEAGIERSYARWSTLRSSILTSATSRDRTDASGRVLHRKHDSKVDLVFNARVQRAITEVLLPALTVLQRACSSPNPYVEFTREEAANYVAPVGSYILIRPQHSHEAVESGIVNGHDTPSGCYIMLMGQQSSGVASSTVLVPRSRLMAVRDEAARPILAYAAPDRLHCPPDAGLGLAGPAFQCQPSTGHMVRTVFFFGF
jgi:hypothetical protein